MGNFGKSIKYVLYCIVLICVCSCSSIKERHCIDYILDDFYRIHFRYPKNLDEFMVHYKKGVFNLLMNEQSDSNVVVDIFNKIDRMDWKDPTVGIEYLRFYKELEKKQEYLQYDVTDEFVELFDMKDKIKYLMRRYDINKEINDLLSPMYHRISSNTCFFDKDENPIFMDEDVMNEWGNQIVEVTTDSVHNFANSKRVMLVYEDNKLYPFDSTYYNSAYDANLNKVLPVVQSFTRNRSNVKKIIFPICVPVLENYE